MQGSWHTLIAEKKNFLKVESRASLGELELGLIHFIWQICVVGTLDHIPSNCIVQCTGARGKRSSIECVHIDAGTTNYGYG